MEESPSVEVDGAVVRVRSASKALALCGWRIGWVVADEALAASGIRFERPPEGAFRLLRAVGRFDDDDANLANGTPNYDTICSAASNHGFGDVCPEILEGVVISHTPLESTTSQSSAHVMASIVSEHRNILIAASDGTLVSDVRPLVRVNIQVIAENKEGRRETGYEGAGGRFDLARLLDEEGWKPLADEAVRSALVNLEAKPCPAGTMDVVLGPGWPGILLHEAIGHGLEGDFNRKQTSAFANRIGERVAAEGVVEVVRKAVVVVVAVRIE